MKKKGLLRLVKSLAKSKGKKSTKKSSARLVEDDVRIIDVLEFEQPSTFRGFKKYKLTIYKEPGVAEGIEHFRNNETSTHFEIKKGTPIRLVTKKVSGLNPFNVMEVYADSNKIGVLYDYQSKINKPFNNVCVRIEETLVEDPYYQDIKVFLFVHYVE